VPQFNNKQFLRHFRLSLEIFDIIMISSQMMVGGPEGQNQYCPKKSFWCFCGIYIKGRQQCICNRNYDSTYIGSPMVCDWLIDYLRFYVPLSIFHLYGDVTIAGEGLQNLGLCSALRAFEQGGIFIMPHLLWHGTSVFPVSSEGPPYLVAFYDTQGDVEDLF
jgi:hypothetical protein